MSTISALFEQLKIDDVDVELQRLRQLDATGGGDPAEATIRNAAALSPRDVCATGISRSSTAIVSPFLTARRYLAEAGTRLRYPNRLHTLNYDQKWSQRKQQGTDNTTLGRQVRSRLPLLVSGTRSRCGAIVGPLVEPRPLEFEGPRSCRWQRC